jgi:hypothetical protein
MCQDNQCKNPSPKELKYFVKDITRSNGHAVICKDCQTRNRKYNRLLKNKTQQIIENMSINERILYLKQLYVGGYSAKDCAIAFSCKIEIIYDQLKKLDIKKCPECSLVKSYIKFNNSSNKSGTEILCKICKKKKRQLYKANRSDERKAEIKEYHKNYEINNRQRRRDYMINRRNSDPIFKCADIARRFIYRCLRNNNYLKKGRTFDINSYWQIDHIIPLTDFDLVKNGNTNWDEIKKCNQLSNLQPLTISENMSKSNKLPDGSRAKYSKIT